MRGEDMIKRISAISNLHVVAEMLGPERTRVELLPYLNEFLENEDEVIIAMCESLGNLLDLTGGPSKAIHIL